MVATKEITNWLTARPVSFKIPFTPGPEIEEFGTADRAGTVTKVPGGQGEVREGTFEAFQIIVVMRARKEDYDALEASAKAYDKALRDLENVMLWGTYVLYVRRQGTLDASFEEPERNSFIANYAIEIGL